MGHDLNKIQLNLIMYQYYFHLNQLVFHIPYNLDVMEKVMIQLMMMMNDQLKSEMMKNLDLD